MEALRFELRRLAHGFAAAAARPRAARVHVLLLVAAVLLAFTHRAILDLPGFGWLAARWYVVVVVAAALYALGPLLARLLARTLRQPPLAMARRLDDRYAWRDETSTAASMPADVADRPMNAFLVAQATGRLREVAPQGETKPPRAWFRVLLAAAFAFVLLAPGVDGLLGEAGAGRGPDGVIGSKDELEPVGPPTPMRADFWLQSFIESPLPVEPLPPEPAPAGEGPERPKGVEGPNKEEPK